MKKILVSAAAIALSALSLNASAGGNIQAGKALVEKFNCAACHGADYNTPIEGAPKLAGQYEDFLTHAMLGYLRGADAANGRSNSIMSPQILRKDKDGKDAPLTSREIRDIAAYLHSLPGSLVTRK